ncbi:MAG: TIM barrel protein [Kordiimonadaceae bacterium]|jgi:sugar phosphate isomerase/epimerase|nr:TIM barrel protein [Kordiimonadaceae bacterium]MBT6033642.1 TIM barrel protein [Kordiimonadaceae bacterium]
MKRRDFIKTSMAAGAAISTFSNPLNAFGAQPMTNKIGVQLYTVRDQMAIDVGATLARVAKIGYKEVEYAGYFDVAAKEMRSMLDQNGLTTPSTHISLTQARDHIDELIEYANIVGHKYIMIGFLEPDERTTLDDYKVCAEVFNKADEACKAADIQFGYHHYDFEFPEIDGQVPYELLLEQTKIQMQIDLYWQIKAGVDMSKYYHKYPGRFPMVHIKDIDVDGNYEDLGKGKIDFDELLKYRDVAGFKHYFVENGTPRNSLETIKIGYDFVKNL